MTQQKAKTDNGTPAVRQMKTADSVFYEITRSLCPECKTVIDAQIHLKQGKVFMRKRCAEHGWFVALISSDAEGYVNSLKYNKPGTIPLEFATEVKDGCPLDCGLCPEHKQHTCLALMEINTGCNLACPTCFANAGTGYNITMEEAEVMLDAFVRAEAEAEVVQFSGGEPTLHPQLFEMMQLAKDKGVRHVMLNTNGLKIVQDPDFARKLGEARPMIYLQFDGLTDETYVKLRGEPLLKTKLAVLDKMAELDLHTILVAAIERGVNEHEVGALIKFGLEHPAVRGVNFQPVTHTGRHLPFDPTDRVTIPEVIERIEDQTEGVFLKTDFVPVPCCHPGCQSITYAYVEDDGKVTPLPRVLNVDDYLDYITNRTWPDPSKDVKHALEALWSSSAVPGSDKVAGNFDFTCTTCNIDLAITSEELAKRVFAVSIKDFLDPYTFDVKKVMKCCIGVLTPDGRTIPFCAYNNVGYREDVREAMQLERARARIVAKTNGAKTNGKPKTATRAAKK
ncbi:MAG: radical SAM protein [Chloroflexi bacterium]|nr:radical SAM protein [Chloroflexota bacterium]